MLLRIFKSHTELSRMISSLFLSWTNPVTLLSWLNDFHHKGDFSFPFLFIPLSQIWWCCFDQINIFSIVWEPSHDSSSLLNYLFHMLDLSHFHIVSRFCNFAWTCIMLLVFSSAWFISQKAIIYTALAFVWPEKQPPDQNDPMQSSMLCFLSGIFRA